jgi:hypothetical protein
MTYVATNAHFSQKEKITSRENLMAFMTALTTDKLGSRLFISYAKSNDYTRVYPKVPGMNR